MLMHSRQGEGRCSVASKTAPQVRSGALSEGQKSPSRFGSDAILPVATIVLGLVAVWVANYVAGGSKTAFPHLFYIPIFYAALRFSWAGAVTSAVLAGLLCGPAMPQNVEDGIAQSVSGWVIRMMFFLAVGLFVALSVRSRAKPFGEVITDTITSRRLLRAVRLGAVEPYFQPIYDCSTRTVVGVEALARWNGPNGIITPDFFIPVAERTGAIVDLDRFMVNSAARTVQSWTATHGPIRLSVNLSATRLADDGLLGEIERVLADSRLPAQQLQIEITESAFIDEPDFAARQIAGLRMMGVRVAIDDFSAGQSSLLYLSQFPVDTVKLDQSLVREVTTDPRIASIVAGVVLLVHGLGADTVAEGVEGVGQCEFLDSIACTHLQGFHIGRPVPAVQALELIERSQRTDLAKG